MKVKGYVWVAHEGNGIPYVAVPKGTASKNINWRIRKSNHFPGVKENDQLPDIGEYEVAKADNVGLSYQVPGCFVIKYGLDYKDAERGIPTEVTIETSELR